MYVSVVRFIEREMRRFLFSKSLMTGNYFSILCVCGPDTRLNFNNILKFKYRR